MKNLLRTQKGITVGFCSLLFGGAATAPYLVAPSISSILAVFHDRSVRESYAFDQYKLSCDFENALASFSDEQAQAQ
jgi:hypothetical protein